MSIRIPEDQIGTEAENVGIDKLKYPWKVTSYKCWDGYPLTKTYQVEGHYRWYWQANLVSWWVHHFWGLACNTWRFKPENEVKMNASALSILVKLVDAIAVDVPIERNRNVYLWVQSKYGEEVADAWLEGLLHIVSTGRPEVLEVGRAMGVKHYREAVDKVLTEIKLD